MNRAYQLAALLMAVGALELPTQAAIFPATAGSITYTNNYFGALSGNFSFTGPQLAITGSGATLANYSALQSLNTPFAFGLPIITDDFSGADTGTGSAGGTDYGPLAFFNMSAALSAVSPIVLTTGNLMVSVPGVINGNLRACTPVNVCTLGGGIPTFPFDVSFALPGTLTVTFAQFNQGSQYTLTNAVFTTDPSRTPEPGTAILTGLAGAVALLLQRGRKQRQIQELIPFSMDGSKTEVS